MPAFVSRSYINTIQHSLPRIKDGPPCLHTCCTMPGILERIRACWPIKLRHGDLDDGLMSVPIDFMQGDTDEAYRSFLQIASKS